MKHLLTQQEIFEAIRPLYATESIAKMGIELSMDDCRAMEQKIMSKCIVNSQSIKDTVLNTLRKELSELEQLIEFDQAMKDHYWEQCDKLTPKGQAAFEEYKHYRNYLSTNKRKAAKVREAIKTIKTSVWLSM